MKEIGIEELKKLQLEILLSVHSFCICRGIEYSLAAGTLIGAVRHKGYIPWDDDVDIIMTRPNFDKFIKTFNGYNNHLTVISPEINWDYYAPYANVYDNRTLLLEGHNGHRGVEIGVKIDVFPIDGMPGSVMEYYRICRLVYKNNLIMWMKRLMLPSAFSFHSLRILFGKMRYSFRSYQSLQKEIHDECTKYGYSCATFAGALTWDPIAFKLPRELFDEYVNVEFEGHQLRAIKEYDWFLKQRYGNYMHLPPENQRIPHHGFTAYWKDL